MFIGLYRAWYRSLGKNCIFCGYPWPGLHFGVFLDVRAIKHNGFMWKYVDCVPNQSIFFCGCLATSQPDASVNWTDVFVSAALHG